MVLVVVVMLAVVVVHLGSSSLSGILVREADE